jgi:hypothetical protein
LERLFIWRFLDILKLEPGLSALVLRQRWSGRMSEHGSNQDGMIPGSDWSMGLNSPTSVSQAIVLASLGGKLRNLYADLIAEGVPEHLAEIVSRIDAGEPTRAIRPPRRPS